RLRTNGGRSDDRRFRPARHLAAARAGSRARASRPHRQRKDDARPSPAPLLRPDLRGDPPRRRRPPRRQAWRGPRARDPGDPGRAALCGAGPRQPDLLRSNGGRRADRRGHRADRPRRLAAGVARPRGGRRGARPRDERDGPIGGRGPAPRLRAGLRARPGARHPGRGLLPARPGDGAARGTRDRRAPRRPHRHRHSASARDGRALRRDPDPRGRTRRGARRPGGPRRRCDVALRGSAANRPRAGAGVTAEALGTGRFLWRMATYRPWLYVADGILWTGVYTARLLPGLVAQRAFDALQFGRPDAAGILWLAALFVGAGIAGASVQTAGMAVDSVFRFSLSAVLQRNMLAEILRRPGARALDRTPGEALSIFRDDVQHAEDGTDWTID